MRAMEDAFGNSWDVLGIAPLQLAVIFSLKEVKLTNRQWGALGSWLVGTAGRAEPRGSAGTPFRVGARTNPCTLT